MASNQNRTETATETIAIANKIRLEERNVCEASIQ